MRKAQKAKQRGPRWPDDRSELVAALDGSGFRVVEQRNGFADASTGVTVLVCVSATRD